MKLHDYNDYVVQEELITKFHHTLESFYTGNSRDYLPWRIPDENGFDPYKIVVSEIMLQQTQVNRVIPYFNRFLELYPDIGALAQSDLVSVLNTWKGLGYNRRAKYLRDMALIISESWDGVFPRDLKDLLGLPGIGKNTAGAVRVYAYNLPEVFIETNIRAVYIHHFFDEKLKVSDSEISYLLHKTMDRQNPRDFYWALMDYGTYLKGNKLVASNRSKHYAKQTKFEGSNRQLRSKILFTISESAMNRQDVIDRYADTRTNQLIEDLISENMITERRGRLYISD